jgi:Transglycosylase SLT domain
MFGMRSAALKGYAAGGPVQYSDTATFDSVGIPDIVNADVAIVKHIADKARQAEVAPSSSPGVAHWRPISLQALSIAGQDASNLGKLEMQMSTESGGNPTAINRYDINWQHGTPSVGLMQVIGPTYARYRHPNYDSQPHEYGVSEDPLSNILAAIRYTVANYGSLASGWQGHGYDEGGWLPPGVTMAYNGTGVPERVLTAPQYQALSAAAQSGGAAVTVNVYPRAEHSEAEIADMVERRLSFSMRAVT